MTVFAQDKSKTKTGPENATEISLHHYIIFGARYCALKAGKKRLPFLVISKLLAYPIARLAKFIMPSTGYDLAARCDRKIIWALR